jgi:hypothetical protein
MAGIPAAQRCKGHADQPTGGGLFAKLFGGR